MFKKIFKELGLSEITQLVFNELLNNGPTTAKLLAGKISIPRPSVYDHLKILIQHGLVMERSEEGRKIFSIDDIKNLEELLNDKINDLENEKKQFKEALPVLLKKANFIEPKIKFYSGKEGVKQVINHIMLNRNIDTILMWPMSEMMKVLGDEYLKDLNVKRVQRNIALRVIWPKDKILDTKKYPYLGSGEEHLRDLRIAPPGMTWDMGYWMYEDKVAFLSSEKEGFGFVVQSQDFAKLIKVQFDEIWKASTEVSN
ncbi:MAG: helix-turn-helix domain-containing protein [Candidatus Paceibacterota bacterium]|jgi:sugar-specific transcriptional regulator TrmB